MLCRGLRPSGAAAAALPRLAAHGRLFGSAEPRGSDLQTPGAALLWNRFVKFAYSYLGNTLYPEKADICNCGADLGMQIKRPELVMREGIEQGSREWRMQMYGAALYWHIATTPGEKMSQASDEMITGKDVLELACMRGGGARYLTELLKPRSYVATDNVEEYIERAKELGPLEGLRFEVADAMSIDKSYEQESFDVVLCVQAAGKFGDYQAFVNGVDHVLRPGGRLILCDAFPREKLKILLEAIEDVGFELAACSDLSRSVHAVGLCTLPRGLSYLRVVATKPREVE